MHDIKKYINKKQKYRLQYSKIILGVFLLSVSILCNNPVSAQTLPVPDIGQDSFAVVIEQSINEAKQFYENLDHSGMQSNLLFNYGFLILNDLEDWNNGVPVMTSLYRWKYMYSGIDNSVFGGTLGLPEFSVIVDSNTVKEKYASSLVGLSILFYRGDYLPDTVIKDMMSANDFSNPAYQPMDIFSGTTLLQNVYNGTVYYHYTPNLLFSNMDDEINEIWVDFEDGSGYRFLNKDLEQTYVISYSSAGEKSIRFKVYTDSDTLISYSRMNIVSLQLDEPDFIGYIPADDSTFVLFNTNKSNPGFSLNGASYAYYEGCDGVLDKPVIICEGFDILGDQTLEYLESKWSGTITDLRARGYDIFLVNIETPENDMYVSADLIKILIKGINDIKQDYFESIYIGESMGGILGRIALKELENEGYDHKVGLYVSYDSPHKGAFIPEGLQYAIAYASFVPTVFQSYYFSWLSLILNLDVSIIDLIGRYASQGASQLMANHILFSAIHPSFQNSLNNLGYPMKSRNVAFSNGSNRAILQPDVIPGNEIFSFQINFSVVGLETKAWYTEYQPTNQLVFQMTRFYFGVPTTELMSGRVSGSYRPYTNAPGGYISNFYEDIHTKFTFVPTASAIDLDESLWNAGNYTFLNENYPNRGKDDLIDNNLTPFDDIYADADNTYHTVDYLDELKEEIEMVEFMPVDHYIQNRYIDNSTDFEGTNSIIAGKYVDTQIYEDVDHNTYQKHIAEGEVIIESGSTVNFRAGNEIILSDGFTAEEGSVFHAEVGVSICPPGRGKAPVTLINTKNIIISGNDCRQISISLSNNKDDNISWSITGENTNLSFSGEEILVEGLPNGQYTVYYTADNQKNAISKVFTVNCVVDREAVNTVKTQDKVPQVAEVFVYPNPTVGEINIIPGEIFYDTEYEIIISDILGKELANYKARGVFVIDISSFSKGIYYLKFKTDSNEINKKIIYN
ncbi:MAG: T9SS type A sorting domain-containing protein [Bacteroidales bacterium]|nr:T9SS type A sorting domain-containing protein [Bacteroidales bacterium]